MRKVSWSASKVINLEEFWDRLSVAPSLRLPRKAIFLSLVKLLRGFPCPVATKSKSSELSTTSKTEKLAVATAFRRFGATRVPENDI